MAATPGDCSFLVIFSHFFLGSLGYLWLLIDFYHIINVIDTMSNDLMMLLSSKSYFLLNRIRASQEKSVTNSDV